VQYALLKQHDWKRHVCRISVTSPQCRLTQHLTDSNTQVVIAPIFPNGKDGRDVEPWTGTLTVDKVGMGVQGLGCFVFFFPPTAHACLLKSAVMLTPTSSPPQLLPRP